MPFTVQLRGNDTQQFVISPTSFDFGNVPLGSSSPQQIVNVTNVGTTAVVMNERRRKRHRRRGGPVRRVARTVKASASHARPAELSRCSTNSRPTALGAATSGSTGGHWNGQSFAFTFKGNGTPRFRVFTDVVRLR